MNRYLFLVVTAMVLLITSACTQETQNKLGRAVQME